MWISFKILFTATASSIFHKTLLLLRKLYIDEDSFLWYILIWWHRKRIIICVFYCEHNLANTTSWDKCRCIYASIQLHSKAFLMPIVQIPMSSNLQGFFPFCVLVDQWDCILILSTNCFLCEFFSAIFVCGRKCQYIPHWYVPFCLLLQRSLSFCKVMDPILRNF